MKMHILSGGRLQMKKHIYLPNAPQDSVIEMPVSCFLFRHSQGNVLFDTGCHPSVAENPEQRWGGMARALVPLHGSSNNVVSELQRINLTPGDIDIVVNSHLHCDHCGCNEYFSKATISVHAEELSVAPKREGKGYFQSDWNHPAPVVQINQEVDIFDDGRLVLLPLPGHTPGLTGLLANLPNSGAYLLASDAVAIREILDLELIPKNTWDQDVHMTSIAEIKRIEKSGTTIICGHDLAQWATFNSPESCYD